MNDASNSESDSDNEANMSVVKDSKGRAKGLNVKAKTVSQAVRSNLNKSLNRSLTSKARAKLDSTSSATKNSLKSNNKALAKTLEATRAELAKVVKMESELEQDRVWLLQEIKQLQDINNTMKKKYELNLGKIKGVLNQASNHMLEAVKDLTSASALLNDTCDKNYRASSSSVGSYRSSSVGFHRSSSLGVNRSSSVGFASDNSLCGTKPVTTESDCKIDSITNASTNVQAASTVISAVISEKEIEKPNQPAINEFTIPEESEEEVKDAMKIRDLKSSESEGERKASTSPQRKVRKRSSRISSAKSSPQPLIKTVTSRKSSRSKPKKIVVTDDLDFDLNDEEFPGCIEDYASDHINMQIEKEITEKASDCIHESPSKAIQEENVDDLKELLASPHEKSSPQKDKDIPENENENNNKTTKRLRKRTFSLSPQIGKKTEIPKEKEKSPSNAPSSRRETFVVPKNTDDISTDTTVKSKSDINSRRGTFVLPKPNKSPSSVTNSEQDIASVTDEQLDIEDMDFTEVIETNIICNNFSKDSQTDEVKITDPQTDKVKTTDSHGTEIDTTIVKYKPVVHSPRGKKDSPTNKTEKNSKMPPPNSLLKKKSTVKKKAISSSSSSTDSEDENPIKFTAFSVKPGKIVFTAASNAKKIPVKKHSKLKSSLPVLGKAKSKNKTTSMASKTNSKESLDKESKDKNNDNTQKSVFDLSLSESISGLQPTYEQFRQTKKQVDKTKTSQGDEVDPLLNRPFAHLRGKEDLTDSPHGIMLVLKNGQRTKSKDRSKKQVRYADNISQEHLVTPNLKATRSKQRIDMAGHTPPRSSHIPTSSENDDSDAEKVKVTLEFDPEDSADKDNTDKTDVPISENITCLSETAEEVSEVEKEKEIETAEEATEIEKDIETAEETTEVEKEKPVGRVVVEPATPQTEEEPECVDISDELISPSKMFMDLTPPTKSSRSRSKSASRISEIDDIEKSKDLENDKPTLPSQRKSRSKIKKKAPPPVDEKTPVKLKTSNDHQKDVDTQESIMEVSLTTGDIEHRSNDKSPIPEKAKSGKHKTPTTKKRSSATESIVETTPKRPRRGASQVSYKEPTLNAKMRRGDKHSSTIYEKEVIEIYKSKKKVSVSRRSSALSNIGNTVKNEVPEDLD